MPNVFVYGAQMRHPESLERGRAAVVEDHAVDFTARGVPVLEPAFADLQPAPGRRAHGVVTDFAPATWDELRAFERGYQLIEVTAVIAASGERVACLALTRGALASPPARPSARYARLLVFGARRHGLPPEVIARYERAAAEGSRITLRLAWLKPLAGRVGLRKLALGVTLLVFALLWLLVWLLLRLLA